MQDAVSHLCEKNFRQLITKKKFEILPTFACTRSGSGGVRGGAAEEKLRNENGGGGKSMQKMHKQRVRDIKNLAEQSKHLAAAPKIR